MYILYPYYFIYDQRSWTTCHHLGHLSFKIYPPEKYRDFPRQHVDNVLIGQLIMVSATTTTIVAAVAATTNDFITGTF